MHSKWLGRWSEKKNDKSLPKEEHNESQSHFRMRVLDNSDDPRRKLEVCLDELAEELRSCPTLPQLPKQVYEECFKDDVALQLPPKHCAFRDCAGMFGTDRRRVDFAYSGSAQD